MKNDSSSPVTLVVGASTNPDRYSYKAIHSLLHHGERVCAFGLRKGEVAGVQIETELPAPETIDTITLYVGPAQQQQLIPGLLALKPRRIIFNPGTENPEFMQQARDKSIETEVACTLVLLATSSYHTE